MMVVMVLRAPSAERAPARHSLAGAVDPLHEAPPLSQRERWAILAVVAAGVATGAGIALARGDEVLPSLFEVLVTAVFAGFVFSPALTVMALAAATVVALATDSSTEMLLALAVATGLVTRTASGRLLIVFGGVLLLSAAAAVASAGSGPLTAVVIYLLLTTVSGAIGLLFRFARRREQRLTEQLVRRAAAEQEIRQEERLLIADELHDVVSHDLTVIVMQTEMMEFERNAESLLNSQRSIRAAARKALRDLHRLVERVDDERQDVHAKPATLASALSEASDVIVGTGRKFSATVAVELATLPRIVDTTLARMLREAVTNVLKHAGPGPVSLDLAERGGRVVLTLRSGTRETSEAAALPSTGYGTIRMAERAALLDGVFHSRREGDKWVVTADLPLH